MRPLPQQVDHTSAMRVGKGSQGLVKPCGGA
jgi:hypothetical protein